MAYHFRFHDQTLSAPDYLVADVLLGRRQRPNLAVSDIGLAALTVLSEDHEKEVMRFRFGLNITIENMGLLTAEAVHVGIVYFDVRKATQQRLSSNLLSFIDVVAVNEARFAYSLSLKSTHMSVDDRLFPFSVQSMQTSSQTTILLPIRLAGKTMSYSWKAAVYVTCEASPPIWHQVTWTIDEEVIGLLLRGDPGYEHLNRTAQRVQQ